MTLYLCTAPVRNGNNQNVWRGRYGRPHLAVGDHEPLASLVNHPDFRYNQKKESGNQATRLLYCLACALRSKSHRVTLKSVHIHPDSPYDKRAIWVSENATGEDDISAWAYFAPPKGTQMGTYVPWGGRATEGYLHRLALVTEHSLARDNPGAYFLVSSQAGQKSPKASQEHRTGHDGEERVMRHDTDAQQPQSFRQGSSGRILCEPSATASNYANANNKRSPPRAETESDSSVVRKRSRLERTQQTTLRNAKDVNKGEPSSASAISVSSKARETQSPALPEFFEFFILSHSDSHDFRDAILSMIELGYSTHIWGSGQKPPPDLVKLYKEKDTMVNPFHITAGRDFNGERYDNIISAFVQLSGETKAGNARCKNCAKAPIYPHCISRPDIQKGSCGCCIYNKNASRCSLRGDDNDTLLVEEVDNILKRATTNPSSEPSACKRTLDSSEPDSSDRSSQHISSFEHGTEKHTAQRSVTLKSRESTAISSLEDNPATDPSGHRLSSSNHPSLPARAVSVAQETSGSTAHHTTAAAALLAHTIGATSDCPHVPTSATAAQDTISVRPRRSPSEAKLEPKPASTLDNIASRAGTTSDDLYTSTPARTQGHPAPEKPMMKHRSPSPDVEVIYPPPAALSTTIRPRPEHDTLSRSSTAQAQSHQSLEVDSTILNKADQRRILCRAFCTFEDGETRITNMNFLGCQTFQSFVGKLSQTRSRPLILQYFCYSLPPHEEDHVIDAEDPEAYQRLLTQLKTMLRDMADGETLQIHVKARV